MLLPKGDCLWKGLNTFFVDIRSLIQFIRYQDFNGYIYCQFKKKQGVIFLHEGDSVCGMLEDGEQRKRGMNIVKDILDSTRYEKDIQLDVYSLPYRSLEIITEFFFMDAKPYQLGLSADFLNIESYVNSHLSNIGFNGYVEIQFQEGDEGFLSFVNGKVFSIITNSLQIRRDKATQNELQVFDMYALKIFERAKSHGAKYDIYARVQ
jgi:hypothetical protein